MLFTIAPAKINWTLEVLGRGDDGYHAIASVMSTISLRDAVSLTVSEAWELWVDAPSVVQAALCSDDNLVRRAAIELASALGHEKDRTGLAALQITRPYPQGLRSGWRATDTKPLRRLHLAKNIPLSAGLGGGSSDAAATLRLLDVYWHGLVRAQTPSQGVRADSGSGPHPFVAPLDQASRPSPEIGRGAGSQSCGARRGEGRLPAHAQNPKRMPEDARGAKASEELRVVRLESVATRLGSDVPFFVRGGTQLARGRGEVLEPLPDPAPRWIVILTPSIAVERKTATLYRLLTSAVYTDGSRSRALAAKLTGPQPGTIEEEDIYNVFEAAAPTVFRGIETYRRALADAAGTPAHLCGAGPSLFALMPDSESADLAARRLREQGLVARAVKVIGRERASVVTHT
jgi:4-diphosphocytidyl-2C-methyl-D-erythritol kinase